MIKQRIKKYFEKKRQKKFKKYMPLKNNDVSIMCNCCIGGGMYHDLQLQFLSPTINLYFSHHCFIDFIIHLKEYIFNGFLIESDKKEETNGAPLGILKCEGLPDIEIHFLHYSNFDIAKQKWIERSKRINYKKIFLVIEAKEEHELSLIDEYLALPYPKIIFTNIETSKKDVLFMDYYKRKPNKPITSYYGFSGKKGYDQFDFVNVIFNGNYL